MWQLHRGRCWAQDQELVLRLEIRFDPRCCSSCSNMVMNSDRRSTDHGPSPSLLVIWLWILIVACGSAVGWSIRVVNGDQQFSVVVFEITCAKFLHPLLCKFKHLLASKQDRVLMKSLCSDHVAAWGKGSPVKVYIRFTNHSGCVWMQVQVCYLYT